MNISLSLTTDNDSYYNITDTNIIKMKCKSNENENITIIFDEIIFRNFTFPSNITIEELKKEMELRGIILEIIKSNNNNNDLLCDENEITLTNYNSSFTMYYSNNNDDKSNLEYKIISLGKIKSNLLQLVDSNSLKVIFTYSGYISTEYSINLKINENNNLFKLSNIYIYPTKPFGLKSVHNSPNFGFVGIPIEFDVFLYDKYSNPITTIENETNLIIEITNKINNYTTDIITPEITKIISNNKNDYFNVKFVYNKRGHLVVKLLLEDKGLNVLYYKDQFTEYPILGNSYHCPIEFVNCKSTDIITLFNETKYGNNINRKSIKNEEENEDIVYSVSYYGYIVIPESGKYLFLFPSNNGVRLTIDREVIYNKWIRYNDQVVIENKLLTKGKHEVFIETRPYDSDNKLELYFYWESENITREIIPETSFRYIKPIQSGNFIIEILPNELIYNYFMEYLFSLNELKNISINYTNSDLLNIIINNCDLKNKNISLFDSILFDSIYKNKCENIKFSLNSTFTDELINNDLVKHYTEKDTTNIKCNNCDNNDEVIDLSYNECCTLIGVQNKNENPGRRRRRH